MESESEISIVDAGLDRFSHAHNIYKRTGMDWFQNYCIGLFQHYVIDSQ
jgi:hypothetical protein